MGSWDFIYQSIVKKGNNKVFENFDVVNFYKGELGVIQKVQEIPETKNNEKLNVKNNVFYDLDAFIEGPNGEEKHGQNVNLSIYDMSPKDSDVLKI